MKKLLLLYGLLVVHFSLYPWEFSPMDVPVGSLLAGWSPLRGRAAYLDLFVNFLFYVPLGALGYLVWRGAARKWWRWAALVAGGTGFSLVVEVAQAWIPGRDSSVRDVIMNGLGTGAGIAMGALLSHHWPARARHALPAMQGPAPLVLASAWLVAQWFPFLPIMRLASLRESLLQLAGPQSSWLDLAETFVSCLLLSSLLRGKAARHAPVLAAFLAIPLRVLIQGSALSWSHIATAASAFALSAAVLSGSRREARLLGGLALLLIAAKEFSPFVLAAAPAAFHFMPFAGLLEASREAATRMVAQKFFLYGSCVWMLREAGLPLWGSTSLVTLLLAAGEATQCWLPGRTPESTDPLLALLAGLLVARCRIVPGAGQGRFWMKALLKASSFLVLPVLLLAQRPWQQITVPALSEAAANFRTPPREYGAIRWLTNGGELTRERIASDLDQTMATGVFVANIGWGRFLKPKYGTPEQIALAKFAVEEAAKRGMRVWIQDEGNYPSGFAGGLINTEYPQLRMQGIVADTRISVAAGQTLNIPVPQDALGAFYAGRRDGAGAVIPLPASGPFQWTAPNSGMWEVVFVRHVYRSSPTRASSREDGTDAKDSTYSLIDYLDPNATRAYLKLTHEKYKALFGAEFGKTVLGFFGDEPDYTGFMPWTPKALEEFQKRKGYDLKPYIPLWFMSKMTEEAWRAKADYWDVWSDLFRDGFFTPQVEWCAANGVEYMIHLNKEETGLRLDMGEDLIRNEGEPFRDFRHVQVPGIDNLGQLSPNTVFAPTPDHGGGPKVIVTNTPDATWDVNNNFPKLASSAAHLFGKPKVWTESGGGSGIDGKFTLDYQLVRGVNTVQIRVPGASTEGGSRDAAPAPVPPQASMIAWYTNRAGYLLSIGRPAAQVGLYYPSSSMWMGDEGADRSTTKLGWQLLEQQVDWDYFDEQSLTSVATIESGGFKNLSGQVYRALIIPSTTVMSRAGLARLQAFAKAGGKVIFVGRTPKLVLDRTFLNAKETPDVSFATLIEPSGDITPRVIEALPKPDLKLDTAFPRLTYLHRSWRDAEMYFFFNESNRQESRTATIAGRGQTQVWDLATGEIHPMSGVTVQDGSVQLPLLLGPYETKLIVVGPLPKNVSSPEPALAAAAPLAELDGDWLVTLNGKQVTTPLRSWEELGTPSFDGPANYRKQFAAPAAPAGKRVFLEIANVRDYARITLNGKQLEARAWQPYRWDITGALKAGSNDLEVEVRALSEGRRGGGGPPPIAPGAAPAGGRGGRGGQAPAAGAPPAAGGRGAAAPPASSGLLGPVRLVAR